MMEFLNKQHFSEEEIDEMEKKANAELSKRTEAVSVPYWQAIFEAIESRGWILEGLD